MRAANGMAGQLPIVQYWHDGRPPDYIAEMLDSFRAHNPGMPQLVFDEGHAEELISERFSSREVSAFQSCAVPAMQADYFRYCAALAHGGLYADADLRCTGALSELMPSPGEGWLVVRPHRAIVNGLFAFGSGGHLLLELTLEIATANIEGKSWRAVYMATGPGLWTTLYWAWRCGSFEAFADRAPNSMWRRYTCECAEIVGAYDRLSRAFEDVDVKPASDLGPFVKASEATLPYKETDGYWLNATGRIYREPRAGSA